MRFFLYFLICPLFVVAQSQIYPVSKIPDSLLNDADIVVREDFMDVEVFALDKMKITVHRVVTILNEDGDSYGTLSVGYDNDLKIRSVSAKILNEQGEEIDQIKKNDFKDFSAVDGMSLYTDNRVLAYQYLIQDYPVTIVFDYEIDTKDTGVIPSWVFMPGYNASVEQSRYTVKYPNNKLRPTIVERNLGSFILKKRETEGSFAYQAQGLKAMKYESLSPSFAKTAPQLMVHMPNFNYKSVPGSIYTWKDVGLWMNGLLEGQDELSPETISTAKQLVTNAKDTLEKAKLIHAYVQENTRYISVQVGIGGLQPISAIEVDRVKYGDCKGLTNYTMALLKAVGVNSYYVVVQAGRDKVDFYDDFADLGQGNHVILTIPYNGKYYWIDCTSQVHPFGFIGDFTDDRQVLVVKPEGGELMKTEAYLNEDNLQLTNAEVKLFKDGSMDAQLNIKTTGIQYDRRFFIENETKENIERFYKNYWGSIGSLRVEKFAFQNQKDSVLFQETLQVSALDYAAKTNDQIIFAPNVFNNSGYVPKRYRHRKLPFEVQRGYLDEDNYLISYPEGYNVENLPQPVHIQSNFGEYQMTYEATQGGLRLKRKFLLKQGYYPPEEYENYRKFRRQVAKTDNTKIIITTDQ
ncbi:GTPase EngB [Croceitalea dokdonensis DOKDO 023]|uniref:GTPase EngB n=1 Tax=Croceitalea dokdonensis DOKDO 023 TaxID=1300341 RepID=A0A0P7A6L7_9FLAO|nr:DUF3857 domain-containing protein [Croceitalea dokdonensis]KPM32393.1 GTPase EngB [Croceitalea dokdonensis DOKDO 023]